MYQSRYAFIAKTRDESSSYALNDAIKQAKANPETRYLFITDRLPAIAFTEAPVNLAYQHLDINVRPFHLTSLESVKETACLYDVVYIDFFFQPGILSDLAITTNDTITSDSDLALTLLGEIRNSDFARWVYCDTEKIQTLVITFQYGPEMDKIVSKSVFASGEIPVRWELS